MKQINIKAPWFVDCISFGAVGWVLGMITAAIINTIYRAFGG